MSTFISGLRRKETTTIVQAGCMGRFEHLARTLSAGSQ
jgi:hypothetical protein